MRLALAAGITAAIAAVVAARADAPRSDFMTVYAVLKSPRCMNCHPAGDAPLQFDTSVAHGQNITRRSVDNGLTCATCHRDKNSALAHQPPGAPRWDLPPVATPMAFQGRTPRQLCLQLKDPAQTRGRDLAALIDHVATDPLVAWGWDPGPGRTPVAIPRASLVNAMKNWAAAGAPCPEE